MPGTRLLALDVGNTSVTAGLFDGSRLLKTGRWPTAEAGHAGPLAEKVARFAGLRRGSSMSVACASVVPSVDRLLRVAFARRFGGSFTAITPRSPLGLRLKVRHPGQVGADRIANAVAAARLCGSPAIVVDFGTATTFDCLSRTGDYLGGAILPGPLMAAKVLAERTAKLPLAAVRKPRRVIGKDTVECLQSGLYYGYLGMIESLLARTQAEMGKASIILTGGYARLYAPDLPGARHVPDLTLQGVRIAHETIAKNRSGC